MKDSPTKSQEFTVPPPPKDGKEYSDKEYNHETKPGQRDSAFVRTNANNKHQENPSGSVDQD
jgi:hypothetical protein